MSELSNASAKFGISPAAKMEPIGAKVMFAYPGAGHSAVGTCPNRTLSPSCCKSLVGNRLTCYVPVAGRFGSGYRKGQLTLSFYELAGHLHRSRQPEARICHTIHSTMHLLRQRPSTSPRFHLEPQEQSHEKKYHIRLEAASARLICISCRHRHALDDAQKRPRATLCRQRNRIRRGGSEQIQR